MMLTCVCVCVCVCVCARTGRSIVSALVGDVEDGIALYRFLKAIFPMHNICTYKERFRIHVCSKQTVQRILYLFMTKCLFN